MSIDKQKIIAELEKMLAELKTEDLGLYSPVDAAKDVIKEYRRKKKISRGEFASMVGISPGCLKDIEKGKPSVRLDNFQKALNAIGRKLYVK